MTLLSMYDNSYVQYYILSMSMKILLSPVVVSKKTTNPSLSSGSRQLGCTEGWRGALIKSKHRILTLSGVFTLTSKH